MRCKGEGWGAAGVEVEVGAGVGVRAGVGWEGCERGCGVTGGGIAADEEMDAEKEWVAGGAAVSIFAFDVVVGIVGAGIGMDGVVVGIDGVVVGIEGVGVASDGVDSSEVVVVVVVVVVVFAGSSGVSVLAPTSTGVKISLMCLLHLLHKKEGVFRANTLRSLAGMSIAPIAPSPLVGINDINATNTVLMLHDGCQCSGWYEDILKQILVPTSNLPLSLRRTMLGGLKGYSGGRIILP